MAPDNCKDEVASHLIFNCNIRWISVTYLHVLNDFVKQITGNIWYEIKLAIFM